MDGFHAKQTSDLVSAAALVLAATLPGCARSHDLRFAEDAGADVADAATPAGDEGGPVSTLDGAPADAAGDAETSKAFLVYSTFDADAGQTATFALRGEDFSVRRVDPDEPALQAAARWPTRRTDAGWWCGSNTTTSPRAGWSNAAARPIARCTTKRATR